MLVYSVYFV